MHAHALSRSVPAQQCASSAISVHGCVIATALYTSSMCACACMHMRVSPPTQLLPPPNGSVVRWPPDWMQCMAATSDAHAHVMPCIERVTGTSKTPTKRAATTTKCTLHLALWRKTTRKFVAPNYAFPTIYLLVIIATPRAVTPTRCSAQALTHACSAATPPHSAVVVCLVHGCDAMRRVLGPVPLPPRDIVNRHR